MYESSLLYPLNPLLNNEFGFLCPIDPLLDNEFDFLCPIDPLLNNEFSFLSPIDPLLLQRLLHLQNLRDIRSTPLPLLLKHLFAPSQRLQNIPTTSIFLFNDHKVLHKKLFFPYTTSCNKEKESAIGSFLFYLFILLVIS